MWILFRGAWSRNKLYYTGKPLFLSLLPSTRRSPWTMLISFVNRSIVRYVIALSLCRLIARLCAKHAIALDWLDALIARACLSAFIQRFLCQHVSKFVETSIKRRSQWKSCSVRFRVETLCKIENREKDVKWNAGRSLKFPHASADISFIWLARRCDRHRLVWQTSAITFDTGCTRIACPRF